MDHINVLEVKRGCDIGYHDEIYPQNLVEGQYPRVGKGGFDKHLNLLEVLEIAYTMNDSRPNIIIKSGKGKWYLKSCPVDRIEEKIETQKWRDLKTKVMYVITWD